MELSDATRAGPFERHLTRAGAPLRYLVAVALTLLAIGTTLAVPGLASGSPFLLAFGALAIAAWYLGFGPAMVVIVGATLGVSLGIEPLEGWDLVVTDSVRLAVFALVAAGITTLASSKRESSLALQAQNRRLEAVHRLSVSVHRADRLEQIYRQGLEAVGEALAADGSEILVATDDGKSHQMAAGGLVAPRASEPASAPLWPTGAATAGPVLVEDLAKAGAHEIAEAHRAALMARGLRAIAWFPFIIRGTAGGGLVVGYREPHEFDQRQVQLAETIAAHLAHAVERRHADESLSRGERQLHFALRSAKMGVWQYHLASGRITWSPEIEEIHGLAPGSFPGTYDAFLSDIHPDDRAAVEQAIQESLAEDLDHDVEYRIVRPDGQTRWISGKGRVVRENGRAIRMSGVCMDVTARKEGEEQRTRLLEAEQRARHELEEAHGRASFLAEASAILGASLDHATTLNAIARAAVPRIADWCSADLLDEDGHLRRLAVAHVDPAVVERAQEIARQHPTDPEESQGIRHVLRTSRPRFYPRLTDGHLAEVSSSPGHLELLRHLKVRSAVVVPLIARHRTLGALTLMSAESGRTYTRADLLLAEELARRAAMAIDNAQLFQELQEASRAKDEFLATVSHELRTPLNAILGWANILRTGAVDPAQQSEALGTIERNATVLTELVQDVLDVSRIVTGQLALSVRPLLLRPVVDAAIEAVRPAAVAKGVVLEVEATGAPLRRPVAGDAARLQQVVWNLLSNAVKFTPAGGRVTVRLDDAAGQAALSVVDTGAGIAPEFLPYVFERFRQADGSTTRRHGGLGLGLAIVRHLVELHGGTVTAASLGKHQGATFTVRLPFAKQAAPRAGEAGRGAESAAIQAHALRGCRVLAVDDDGDTRDLLAYVLTSSGAETRVVGSARAAMAELTAWRPDLLVLDIGMPAEDGYDLLRWATQRYADDDASPRAVALTAHAGPQNQARAMSAGFELFIDKPFEPAQLIEQLQQLWRRAQTQDPQRLDAR